MKDFFTVTDMNKSFCEYIFTILRQKYLYHLGKKMKCYASFPSMQTLVKS